MTLLKSTLFNLVLTLFYMHSLLQLHLYSDLLFSNNIKRFSFFILSLLSSFLKWPQVYKWLLYFSTLISLFRWLFIKKCHLKRFFYIINKKITVVKRFYSIRNTFSFNTFFYKKIPKLLKYFYYNWMYYYFFIFKHSFRISYDYSLIFVSLNNNNYFNRDTINFYSLLKKYYYLSKNEKQNVHELYINSILNKRRNWVFSNYGKAINCPILMEKSILNAMLYFFLFKSPKSGTKDVFVSNWIYILKTDVLKYNYKGKYINVICCFYFSSFEKLSYDPNNKTYNFYYITCDITCDITYNSNYELENKYLDGVLPDFVRSKYGRWLDNDLKFSLYKLLDSLKLLSEVKDIHFNLGKDVHITYDHILFRNNKRKYSTLLFIKKSALCKRFYMKSFLKKVKKKEPIELLFFRHPLIFNIKKLKEIETYSKKIFSNKQISKAYLNNKSSKENSLSTLKNKEYLTFSKLIELLDKPHIFLFFNLFGYNFFYGLTSLSLPHFYSSKEDLANFKKNKDSNNKTLPLFKGEQNNHVLHKSLLNNNLEMISELPIKVLEEYEIDVNALIDQLLCAIEAGDIIIYDSVQTKPIKGTKIHELLLKNKDLLKFQLKDYELLNNNNIKYTILPKYELNKDINENDEESSFPFKEI